MSSTPSRRVAEELVERRLTTPQQVAEAEQEHEATGRDAVETLVSSGRVRQVDALNVVADQLDTEFVDLARFTPIQDAISRLEASVAVSESALPVRIDNGVLVVAVADPLDEPKRIRLQTAAHIEVRLALAPEQELVDTVRRVYFTRPLERGFDPDVPTPTGVRVEAGAQESPYHINVLLELLLELGGSDLHLAAGAPPQVRLNGTLVPLEGYEVLKPAGVRSMIYDILSARHREELENELELDASHPVPGRGRFRINVFFQRGAMGAVMRAIPNRIAPLGDLGMPPVVAELTSRPRGLVLVTGATGTGKSTTLASMIDLINQERAVHIITVEDPIEFMHSHNRAVVNQREVGSDTQTFSSALKHALRQDPDVILVGEMRDLETMATTLTAAETGHLVFATLHTHDAPGSVARIIDVFPPHQQQQVRVQLAETLQGVISQQLLPTVDGTGRVPAIEIMIATPAIRNLIREGKVPQIKSAMQSGGQHGMQVMDKALAELVRSGVVDMAVAAERAQSNEDFMNLLGGAR